MNGPAEWAMLAVAAIGGLGGLGALLNALFSRRKSKADAAQVITGTAMEWIGKFEKAAEAAQAQAELAQSQARQAQEQAAKARDQMQAAQVQIERVTAEARALATELQLLRTAILRPDASLDALRLMVRQQSPNGRG